MNFPIEHDTLRTQLAEAIAARDKVYADAGAAMHRICGLGSDPAVTDTVETLIAYAAKWHADREALRKRAEAAETELKYFATKAKEYTGMNALEKKLAEELLTMHKSTAINLDTWPTAKAFVDQAKTNKLVEASKAMLDRYLKLVDSGDAGNWEPRNEEVVKNLQAVLDEYNV